MGRMAIPRMDVVRFKEADVLCASGPKPFPIESIRFAGFNNGTYNDATMNGQSVEGYVSYLTLTHENSNVYFKYGTNDKVHANDLLTNEENNKLANGDYTPSQDGTNVLWTWKHQ